MSFVNFQAKELFLENYSEDWAEGRRLDVTEVSLEAFKDWAFDGRRKIKPFAEYKSVRDITRDVDQTPTNVDSDGVIVDGDGKPLTLYHGTPNDVELSDLEMGHTRAGGEEAARYNGEGISFTPNRDVAVDYASDNGGEGKVFEVNVTLKNPYYTLGVANFTPEEAAEFTASLRAKGHDGIINYQSKAMREAGAMPNEVIVFDVKSAAPVDKPASREMGPAQEDNGKAEASRLEQKEDGSVGSAEVGGVGKSEKPSDARPQYDRTVPTTPEAQRSAISRIIDFAKSVRNRVERAVIGGITKRQARDFAENGIDVDETWVHSFESSAVAHNQKHHGNVATEASRGQIAISPEDYARIPDILEEYDRVSKSPNKTKGTENEVIIYEKEFEDGYIYYLEEKRDNRKSLSFHTMYKKKKGTDSSDGFAANSTAPITPLATPDNLSSNSDGKGNALLGDKQATGAGSSSMEDGLLAFARSFGEGVEGIPEIERRLASWLGERSIEELADLDADMLRRVAVSAGLDKGKAWDLRMAIDRATPKNRLREVFEERSRRKRRDAEDGSVGSAEDGSIPFHRGGDGEADRVAYEAAKGMLEAAGVPVVEVGDAEAKAVVGDKKTPVAGQPNRANEKLTSGSVLLSISGNSSSNRAASKEAVTKVANNSQSTRRKIAKFKNGDFDVDTMRETPLWEEVMNDPNYADIRGDEDAVASEVHSRLTGKRGKERMDRMMDEAKGAGDYVEQAEKISLVNRLKSWLADMFRSLKGTLEKWSKRDLRGLTAEVFADMTLRDLAEGVNPKRGAIVAMETSDRDLRFHAAMTRGVEDFEAVRERAVAGRGIVMPGLNEARVRVVEVPRHNFSGAEPIGQARRWAKENIVGEHTLTDSRGAEVPYSISGRTVNKYLSSSAIDKSDNLGVHLSVLKMLPEVIGESIEAEVHPDYKKGPDGERNPENGYSDDKLIHRFYGAVRLEGKDYLVKTTIIETRDNKVATTPHSFEVTQIELLSNDNSPEKLEPTVSPNASGVPRRTANLLKGVEKSYDSGKKLLDESDTVMLREGGDIRFREVAAMIAEQLDGTDIAIPYNVVQPQVRSELERLGVGISEEATGSVGKEADFGKAEYITDQEIERINARQREMAQTSPEAKMAHAEKMAERFDSPIRIVNDLNELTNSNKKLQSRMRKAKGFYDPATGEVVVVVPNNATVEDVAETVFHEMVAHKGLREMIGEDNYDAFCDEVYGYLKDDLKKEVDEETTRRFMNEPGKGYEHHRRVAVDEMFGRMAEKGFEDFTKAERGIWAKLKAKVLEGNQQVLGFAETSQVGEAWRQ